MEDPEKRGKYNVHSYYEYHNHDLNVAPAIFPSWRDQTNYFLAKKNHKYKHVEKQATPFRNHKGCWKHHFLRSVEYEITVINGNDIKY